ncbi:hypothetical protein ARSEF1564_001639 [Beauveria bassiana]
MADKESLASFDVYPVHMFDDCKGPRSIMMRWIFRVDAQLDADKLRTAFAQVLETGDWRKLAGRLHYTKTGGLEIHVPHEFTEQDPPFTYTHRDHSAELFDADPARRTFPRAASGPHVYSRTPAANAAVFAPGVPTTLAEHISRGLPQLGLHVTTFRDATLMELTWPHTVMDGTGQRDLLAAWSLALAGRAHDIPPLAGAREDVPRRMAERYADADADADARQRLEEDDVMQDRALTGLGKLLFFCRLLWRLLTSPRADWRVFRLPRAVVARWREDVEKLPPDPKTGKPPFVSNGDLICAWLVTLAAAGRSPRRRARYVVAGSVNCRSRIPALQDGTYVQNLLSLYFASVPNIGGPGDDSLARFALAHRAQVAAQTTETQILHHFQRRRAEAEAGQRRSVPLYCRADDVVLMCNNLSGLRIGAAADFGPAVVVVTTAADGTRASGRVVSHYYLSSDDGNRPTPYFVCLDQDEEGYWIRANASPGTWERIIREISAGEAHVHI